MGTFYFSETTATVFRIRSCERRLASNPRRAAVTNKEFAFSERCPYLLSSMSHRQRNLKRFTRILRGRKVLNVSLVIVWGRLRRVSRASAHESMEPDLRYTRSLMRSRVGAMKPVSLVVVVTLD